MTGFAWAPFAVDLAAAAGTALAVRLAAFAVGRAKGHAPGGGGPALHRL